MPPQLQALEDVPVDEVSAGGTHTVAIAKDGRVFAWGRGSYGRLGVGTSSTMLAPQQARLPATMRPLAVSAGGTHTLLLCERAS